MARALASNQVVEVLSSGDNRVGPYVTRKVKSILDDPRRKIHSQRQRALSSALQRIEEILARKDAEISVKDEDIARKTKNWRPKTTCFGR